MVHIHIQKARKVEPEGDVWSTVSPVQHREHVGNHPIQGFQAPWGRYEYHAVAQFHRGHLQRVDHRKLHRDGGKGQAPPEGVVAEVEEITGHAFNNLPYDIYTWI